MCASMKPTYNEWAHSRRNFCLNSHTLHRSSFTLWPISWNLILYASLRGQYITVVYGYEMSVELNTLAISPPASSPFLAGHLRGAESFVYFNFLQWQFPTEWVMKNVTFKCLFLLPSYLLLLSVVYLSQSLSFSPVVCSLFWKLRLLKRLFSLFLQLLWPRSSLLIYSSCYHGGVRWHKAQRGRYSNNDRICPCVLLLIWLFLLRCISSYELLHF